jgi:hypothetical protein
LPQLAVHFSPDAVERVELRQVQLLILEEDVEALFQLDDDADEADRGEAKIEEVLVVLNLANVLADLLSSRRIDDVNNGEVVFRLCRNGRPPRLPINGMRGRRRPRNPY